jgi:hypothetical protein
MKKRMIATALAVTGVIGAVLVAPTAHASGDQDAAKLAAEMNAAATDASDYVTATQARNNAVLVCGMRSGEFSGSAQPKSFTEGELIAQFGGDHWATVMVTRGEYHFCPEYSS